MLTRLLLPLFLAASTPINLPIIELPPLAEPAIATEPAVRLDIPLSTTTPDYSFSGASDNGRCIGAEPLLTRYGTDWNVIRMSRIMYRESRCKPLVRNKQSGSTGLLQIMPSNCPYISRQLGESCTVSKLQDATFNIRAAVTLFEYDGYGPWNT